MCWEVGHVRSYELGLYTQVSNKTLTERWLQCAESQLDYLCASVHGSNHGVKNCVVFLAGATFLVLQQG